MKNLRIAVLGMGYVGLASSVAFAKFGYKSICTTTTQKKANELNKGIPPFYEPGLEELLVDVLEKGMFSGSTDNIEAVIKSDITFVCVGTPSLSDGSADLSAIEAVSKDIGLALNEKEVYHVVVVKSTIPPGTTENVVLPILEKYSGKKVSIDFGLCMNPEFLRQGSAVHDIFYPDRIVIGQYDEKSGDLIDLLYSYYDCPKLRCEIKVAELIKYAANSLLATKISFTNEFSRICERVNVDVYEVMKGVGLDFRINPQFLNAGVGFGGSCLPKDIIAIKHLANSKGIETPLLDSVLINNNIQPMHFVNIIESAIGDIDGKVIAFLGLSFKPNTEDVRETRALPIIKYFYDKGAKIRAYDPKAVENFKRLTDLPIAYYDDVNKVLDEADFAVIQSDWKEIQDISAQDYKELLKNAIIFDGRRTYDPEDMISKGVKYFGIGWKNLRDNEDLV